MARFWVLPLIALLCAATVASHGQIHRGVQAHVEPPQTLQMRLSRLTGFQQADKQYHIPHLLSHDIAFLPTLVSLYRTYGKEIVAQRQKMRLWCQQTNSCKFCDEEAEMVYMLLREMRPKSVFEMAPNRGYSTSWMLAALEMNKYGNLTSFDLHDACTKNVPANPRWTFIKTVSASCGLYLAGSTSVYP